MGGTRTYFAQLLNFYLDQGVDLLVIRQGSGASDDDLGLESPCSMPILEWSHVTQDLKSSQLSRRLGVECPRDIKLQRERSEAVACWYGADMVVASVGRPGAFLGAMSDARPSLYFLHTYPHGLRSRVLSRLMLPEVLPESASVVTVSNYAREEVIRRWRMGARTKDVAALYSTAGPLRPPRNYDSGRQSVLTLGHLEAYKDPLGWIDLAATVLSSPGMDDCSFTWAGEGSLLDKCVRAVQRRGLEGRVRFIGRTDDVEALYDDCDVYLQPSLVESLGLAVLDATRRGIPSVVTDAGGLPETVDSGITGFVYRSGDSEAGAMAVIALLGDTNLRKEMGEMAQRLYRSRFSPNLWRSRLLSLHCNALSG